MPPWFDRGFDFKNRPQTDIINIETEQENSHVVNLSNILKEGQQFLDLWKEPSNESGNDNGSKSAQNVKISIEDSDVINSIPEEVTFRAPVIRISEVLPLKGITTTEWAQVIDVSQPVTDFHERLPDLAFKFDFELDTFQKQVWQYFL